MADVTLTFNFDTEDQAGPCTVTLPDGRAFEHGAVVKWRTKEAAEAAVREHFGGLQAYLGHRHTPEEVAKGIAVWAEGVGRSIAHVEADLRLIGIDPATGADVATEAGATPPQRQDDIAPFVRAIDTRIAELEARRLALSVEMLETQGAIEALRVRADTMGALFAMSQAQVGVTEAAAESDAFVQQARDLGVELEPEGGG